MAAARKSDEAIVQSTLRLPRSLWKDVNKIAAEKHLSMQQAVNEALRQYVAREKGGK